MWEKLFDNFNEYYKALIQQNHPLHKEAMEIRSRKIAKQNMVYTVEGSGKHEGELIVYRVN